MESLEILSQRFNDHFILDSKREEEVNKINDELKKKIDFAVFCWIMGIFVMISVTVWGVLYARQEANWYNMNGKIELIQKASQETAMSVAKIQGILETASIEK